MYFETLCNFLAASIVQGTPLLFGATGEILTEKSGNLNLGIPGIMYVGGISSIIGCYFYEHAVADPNPFLCVLIAVLCSILGSLFMALIYCFLTINMQANQNVTGLALTTFGVGLGNFFGASLPRFLGGTVGSIALNATGNAFRAKLPFASSLGIFGETFLSFGFLTYLAVVIALIASLIINRTRVGLNLRSVGESPATADAAGINVKLYKYMSTCIGAVIAGFGGMYFVMDYLGGTWTNNGFGDRGWLAVAIVIFALWKPKSAILSSYLFGGLYICCVYIPGLSSSDKELIKMAPYLVTVLVLIVSSLRKRRENQPPAHLGLHYFREDR